MQTVDVNKNWEGHNREAGQSSIRQAAMCVHVLSRKDIQVEGGVKTPSLSNSDAMPVWYKTQANARPSPSQREESGRKN